MAHNDDDDDDRTPARDKGFAVNVHPFHTPKRAQDK